MQCRFWFYRRWQSDRLSANRSWAHSEHGQYKNKRNEIKERPKTQLQNTHSLTQDDENARAKKSSQNQGNSKRPNEQKWREIVHAMAKYEPEDDVETQRTTRKNIQINMKLNENTSCLNSFLKISRKQFSVRDSLWVVCVCVCVRALMEHRLHRQVAGNVNACFLVISFVFFPLVGSFSSSIIHFALCVCVCLCWSSLWNCWNLCGCVWFYLFCKWIYLWLFVCLLRSMATYGLNMCEWMSQMLSFIRCKVELPYQDIVCHLSLSLSLPHQRQLSNIFFFGRYYVFVSAFISHEGTHRS